MPHKVTINLENRLKRFMTVIIEPSAETYAIPIGKTMTIIGIEKHSEDCNRENIMHIEYLEDYIKIWEWERGDVEIYIDGNIAEPGIPQQ